MQENRHSLNPCFTEMHNFRIIGISLQFAKHVIFNAASYLVILQMLVSRHIQN